MQGGRAVGTPVIEKVLAGNTLPENPFLHLPDPYISHAIYVERCIRGRGSPSLSDPICVDDLFPISFASSIRSFNHGTLGVGWSQRWLGFIRGNRTYH